MGTLLQGWMLGIAYVAPIGMQNMYVINTAVQKSRARALQVALITIFFDITLALACYFGIGYLLDQFAVLKMIVMGFGSLAVIFIGIMLIRSKSEASASTNLDKPILEVVMTCFAVTWLNPQAIVDGTLLLSGFRATLSGTAVLLFIAGVCLASCMWFLGISTFVTLFKDKMTSSVLNGINIVCGSIIVLFGIKLGYVFLQSIM